MLSSFVIVGCCFVHPAPMPASHGRCPAPNRRHLRASGFASTTSTKTLLRPSSCGSRSCLYGCLSNSVRSDSSSSSAKHPRQGAVWWCLLGGSLRAARSMSLEAEVPSECRSGTLAKREQEAVLQG